MAVKKKKNASGLPQTICETAKWKEKSPKQTQQQNSQDNGEWLGADKSSFSPLKFITMFFFPGDILHVQWLHNISFRKRKPCT